MQARNEHISMAFGLVTYDTVALTTSLFYHSSVSCVIMYDGLGRIFPIKPNISALSTEMRLGSFFMASALPSALGRLLFSVSINQICRFFYRSRRIAARHWRMSCASTLTAELQKISLAGMSNQINADARD